MDKIPLVKRQFLGITYFNFFKHNETGEVKVVEITQQEYENLAGNTPILEGYTWFQAGGEMIKVDTPKKGMAEMQLDWNEYCDYEDGYYILTKNDNGEIRSEKVAVDAIADDELDVAKLEPLWQ